jgi:hypothetical protein
MTYSPLTVKRRNVLGDLCEQCDAIESIPVYLNDVSEEPLGFVTEDTGRYVDVFTFYLSETVCKELSSNNYDYAFDFDYSEKTTQDTKKRIRINHIVLVLKKKPLFIKKSLPKLAGK